MLPQETAPGGSRLTWLRSTLGVALSALRTQMVLAHEDATAGGLAVHRAPLLRMVVDKDLATVTVSEETVPAPE
eukprot:12936006-Prorocentrum_lima.AAC.1